MTRTANHTSVSTRSTAEMTGALPHNVHRITQQACCCRPATAATTCCQLNDTSAQCCVSTYSERHRQKTDGWVDGQTDTHKWHPKGGLLINCLHILTLSHKEIGPFYWLFSPSAWLSGWSSKVLQRPLCRMLELYIFTGWNAPPNVITVRLQPCDNGSRFPHILKL